MSEDKYLYHITDNPYQILNNGIIPKIGPRSAIAIEDTPSIYLSDANSLPYWMIILGSSNVVRINTDKIDMNGAIKMEYSHYSEILFSHPIPADAISVTNDIPFPTTDHMKDLCRSYLYTIHFICEKCALYYFKHGDWFDDLRKILPTALFALNNLNYEVYTKEQIKEQIVEYGESGEYAFTDTCDCAGKMPRLYEALVTYPKDELEPYRIELYNYIVKTFSGCLDLDTGGWIL